VSKVKDVYPGSSWGFVDLLTHEMHGLLFFQGNDPEHGTELWVSGGSEAETRMVEDLRPGTTGSDARPTFVFDGMLYFHADLDGRGYRLFRTDGTSAAQAVPYLEGQQYTVVDDALYYLRETSECGRELWVSDGSEAGSELVYDLNPGAGSGAGGLFHHEGVLYVSGDDGSTGLELYRYDLP
jgi:ELWxxDGT repeat protein